MFKTKRVVQVLAVLVLASSSSPADAATYSGCQSSIMLRYGVSPAPSEVTPTYIATCRATYPTTSSAGRGVVEAEIVPPGATFARTLKFTFDSSPYGDTKQTGSVWNWAIFVNGSLRANGSRTEQVANPILPGDASGSAQSESILLEPTSVVSNISVHWARGNLFMRNWGPGSAYCGQAGRDGGTPLPC